jgi:hypothetical protein
MNTTERIEEIIKEVNEFKVDSQILRLELEALVIQAQLEQLKK